MGDFLEIYRAFYGKVFTFVLSLVKSKANAQDITQNIFMKLWKNRKKLEHVKSMDDYRKTLWDIKARTVTKLYDKPGTVEYYPITIDKESFYYSQHVSPTDNHDQLYKGFFDGRTSIYLAFNKKNADYSDACPVSNEWLILVSTRSDSKGGYDLYIANETSGAIYPLSDYNSSINTSKNELGPDYIPAAR